MNLLRNLLTTFVLGLMLTSPTVGAEEDTYPSAMTLEQVEDCVNRCKVDHPRLLTNGDELAQLRRSFESTPLGKVTVQGILLQADAMLAVDPIKRRLQGRRLLGQSRRCVKRVLTLAMAFHLSGHRKYVERAEKEMLAVAAFSDWNPSHFLDVAEMTFAMAVGYDWLFHELNRSSRDTVRAAIIRKGLTLPFTSRHKGWVRSRNNWGQVCHGGLTAGALAILEDEPKLAARTVHNALHNVRYSMDAYAPNGSYPEGPGYWVYGTSYNVLLIAVLESALGSDFGLLKARGFSMTGQYPALVCGPSGEYFNYADGGAGRSADPTLFWLAKRFDRPDWLLGEHERLRKTIAGLNARNAGSYGSRLLPLVLLWMDSPQGDEEVHLPLHWNSGGHVPISVHRSSWTNPQATFVGVKGGSPSANHGQMDIGSFVLDADGRRWAIDLGAEGYHGIESRGMNLWDRGQDSDRWTIFRQCNSGHNTLVINGQLQRAAGHGSFLKFSDDPTFPHSVLDMTEVYKGQAEAVQRGVALLPSGEVLIQDQLTGLKPGASVRWGMITPGTANEAGSSTIQLHQGDAELDLAIMAPATSIWTVLDTETPRNPWDSPNRGTCMVAFEQQASPSGELTFVVLATPGSCKRSEKKSLRHRRLEEWE